MVLELFIYELDFPLHIVSNLWAGTTSLHLFPFMTPRLSPVPSIYRYFLNFDYMNEQIVSAYDYNSCLLCNSKNNHCYLRLSKAHTIAINLLIKSYTVKKLVA